MICWHEKHILLELLEQMDVMRLHVTVVAFIAILTMRNKTTGVTAPL